MKNFDVIVLGAGAAGMMVAKEAGQRGRRVAIIDHSPKPGQKILLSGGGHCNFTNTDAGPDHYISQDPSFPGTALVRFTPQDFMRLVRSHAIAFHEKKSGQLFCDGPAKGIVDLLEGGCRKSGVLFYMGHRIKEVRKTDRFIVETGSGDFSAPSLVIATGGLSYPKAGASDLGYRLARQFALKVLPTAPALDGFIFSQDDLSNFDGLAGISTETTVVAGGVNFRENILFTHTGLSGPAALQASLYWHPGGAVTVNFVPDKSEKELQQWFLRRQKQGIRSEVKTVVSELLPKRLAGKICRQVIPGPLHLNKLSPQKLSALCRLLHGFQFIPRGTAGYGKAEVTRGGLDTHELFPKTMEARKVPGLYFIGEVVDVTGQLGGYNLQWAWSSGFSAGQAV